MDGHARRSPLAQRLVTAVTENFGLKLTSLLIAMAVFGMVRGAGNVQRAVEVSLLERMPPTTAHRVLLTELPTKVRVTLRGSPAMVSGVRSEDLGPIQIDLSDGRRSSVMLDASGLQIPAGVQVVSVQPSELSLAWDALVERDVPLRPELTGAPAPGTRLAGPPEVQPPSVHVAGASLYVDSLAAVHTDPVDITGLGTGHYERRVAIDPPRHSLHYSLEGGARVSFTLEQEISERRFERVPITPVGRGSVALRPPVATVVLRGAPQALAAIDVAEIVPTVELGEGPAPRSGSRVTVQLPHVPAGATLVSIEPTDVIVTQER
jgi:hypothetical protein